MTVPPLDVTVTTDTKSVKTTTKEHPMKRRPMRSKQSKKLFSRTAKKVHRKNGLSPMRGGIRI